MKPTNHSSWSEPSIEMEAQWAGLRKHEIFSSSSSAQIVLSIEDLLLQILMGLPIKSLIQFKSVSKHWYSLITSPDFFYQRNSKPAAAIGLLFPNEIEDGTYHLLPYSIRNPAIASFRRLNFSKDLSTACDIEQSCNGLLLCRTRRADVKRHVIPEKERHYYVCNPTTMRFFIVPKVPEKCITKGMYLAYDPSKSPHYKVVAIFRMLIDFETVRARCEREIWIYSSEVDSWKKCRVPSTIRINLEHGAAYWNGALHRFEDVEEEEVFLVFKVDDETFHIMPSPPYSDKEFFWGTDCLMVSGDHLHYMEIVIREMKFNIYEVKRDYSEWFVKYQVDLSCLVDYYPEIREVRPCISEFCYYHISFVRGDTDDGSFLVLDILGKIIKYYIVENRYEMLYETGRHGGILFDGVRRYEFIESFCLI